MKHRTLSDGALVRAYLNGDLRALTQLWLRYDGLVYGIAHSALKSREDAEEARQETFLNAIRNLASLRTPERFGPWLKTITYNVCKSALRRRRSLSPLDAVGETEGPRVLPDDGEQREWRTLVRQSVDELPDELREVIDLYYYEGERVAAIAAFLELTETTVKWRLRKARELLKRKPDIWTKGAT